MPLPVAPVRTVRIVDEDGKLGAAEDAVCEAIDPRRASQVVECLVKQEASTTGGPAMWWVRFVNASVAQEYITWLRASGLQATLAIRDLHMRSARDVTMQAVRTFFLRNLCGATSADIKDKFPTASSIKLMREDPSTDKWAMAWVLFDSPVAAQEWMP